MTPDLPRFSAASGLLAGLFLAVAGFVSIFTGKTAGAAFVIALAPALAVPLLVAVYHQRHADVPGVFGPVAYAVNLIGLGLFGGAAFTIDTALFYLATPVQDHLEHEPTIAALLGSAVIFAAGSVLFGVFLLRARAYPRLLCWAYTVFPALLAALSPLPDSPLKNAVHCLTGATIAWLAVTLWRTKARPAPRMAGSRITSDLSAELPDLQGSRVRGCLTGSGPARRPVPADVARSHLPGVNRGAGCFGFNCRMVVIFGFGPGSQEDQGEVAPCVCPNCHNQVFLHYVRSKKSVRLYFVPVVPYGTDSYLVCPVCSRGLQVSDAQLRHVRSMSSATASFRAGRLSQARYMAQADRFWRQLGVNPAGQQLPAPASPGAPVPAQPATSVRSAAPDPPPAADDRASWISQLRQLAQLHNQGTLSDAAYAAAKRRILEQDKQPPPPGPATSPGQ